MLVVDASVIAPVVADAGDDGLRYRARLRGERLVAPDLLRVEVLSVLRRQVASGHLSPEQADRAVEDLVELPLEVVPSAAGIARSWQLRDNVTPYDASYVVVAEALGCPLLTADRRLAGAPGVMCEVEII